MSELVQARRARLRAAMAEAGLDALVLGRPGDIAYATGAQALWTSGSRPFSPSCVLVGDEIHLLSTWDDGVPDDIPHDHLFGLSWNPAIAGERVAAIDGLAGADRIGAAGTSAGFEKLVARIAPGAEVVDARSMMADVRAVKTAEEVSVVERACRLARTGVDVLSGAVDVGTNARHLLAVLAHRLGQEDDTVIPDESVAFATRRGFADAATAEPFERGELVAVASSVRVEAYMGTRATTVTVGAERSAEQADLRDRCTAALAAVVAACVPGATGGALLDAWRGAGGGDLPVPLAHGLGLGVEPPLVGFSVGADEPIVEGMVLAVQGWIHEDGVGGWLERQVVHVGPERARAGAGSGAMTTTRDHSDDDGPTEPPVVDVDHHDPAFHAARHDRWAELRAECPVAWNPNHGGYWMVAGHDEVATVSRDGVTFSSLYEPDPVGGIRYEGISGVPRIRGVPKAGIAEVEGAPHVALRRALNPFVLPSAVAELEPLVSVAAAWFLDQVIEDGEADLLADYLSAVTAVSTMAIVGLPLGDWRAYAELFHAAVALPHTDPVHQRAMARVPDMMQTLFAEAADRRAAPRDDLLTALVSLEVDGEPLDDQAVQAVLWNLVGGGLDTTASLAALSLLHLTEHPDQRRRLIDEPELLPSATEEFLRYFSVNESLSRTVATETELGGQTLAPGDRVLFSWLSANRDESVFTDPDDVVLDRAPNPHLAFGVGAHRCLGMHVARSSFQVLVREVLDRIPDYEVVGPVEHYADNPTLNGLVALPVRFTPGTRRGPAERPF